MKVFFIGLILYVALRTWEQTHVSVWLAIVCDLLCVSVCEYISYLSFRQTEVDSQFRFPSYGDVSVEMKLLLQLQSLMVGVNYPVFLLRSRFTCEGDKKKHGYFCLSVFGNIGQQPSGWTGTFLESRLHACHDRPNLHIASLLAVS